MRKIDVKNVEDGMVLEEPLYGASGNILMPKGIKLRAALIPRLRAWGVNSVCVDGEEEDDGVRNMNLTVVEKIPLETLFTGKMVNNAMQMVFNALAKFRNKDCGTVSDPNKIS